MSSFFRKAPEKAAVEKKKDDVNFKATYVAGSSVRQLEDLSEEQRLAADQCWSACDEGSFSLRVGPNYEKTGKKAPSPPALYELVGVDFIQSSKRIDNIGSKVIFPAEWTDTAAIISSNSSSSSSISSSSISSSSTSTSSSTSSSTSTSTSDGQSCVATSAATTSTSISHSVPTIFIVNTQFPKEFSTNLFTEAPSDGEGWSLVHYFRVKGSVLKELENEATASNAVKMFAKYCKEAPGAIEKSTSPWYGRFKVMSRCENIDEFGLPSFITSYNAKPVLIRNTAALHCGTHYMELDLNVHRFGSLPKKALSTMIDKFSSMRVSTGFCIESRGDAEMPETLLGSSTCYKPDYTKASHWDELNAV